MTLNRKLVIWTACAEYRHRGYKYMRWIKDQWTQAINFNGTNTVTAHSHWATIGLFTVTAVLVVAFCQPDLVYSQQTREPKQTLPSLLV